LAKQKDKAGDNSRKLFIELKPQRAKHSDDSFWESPKSYAPNSSPLLLDMYDDGSDRSPLNFQAHVNTEIK
jgi:hypothetical protein